MPLPTLQRSFAITGPTLMNSLPLTTVPLTVNNPLLTLLSFVCWDRAILQILSNTNIAHP